MAESLATEMATINSKVSFVSLNYETFVRGLLIVSF